MVIGTRNTEASKIVVRQPRLREWLGGSYTWLANQVTNAGVTDFTCGFKAFRLSAAKEIFERQLLDSWSFDAEVLFLTRKFGFRLSEIPIEWRNNPKTRVRLARDVFVSLFGLILIRVNDSFRRYKRIHTRVASDG